MPWIDVKIANAKDGALNGPQFAPDMLSSCGQIYGTAKAPRESFMIHPKKKKEKKKTLYDFSFKFLQRKEYSGIYLFLQQNKADASDGFAERFFLKYRLEMRKWEAE